MVWGLLPDFADIVLIEASSYHFMSSVTVDSSCQLAQLRANSRAIGVSVDSCTGF